MIQYYAIPNEKRKRLPQNDDLEPSDLLTVTAGPSETKMQIDPTTVRMEQLHTGKIMGKRTLPKQLPL